MKFANRRRLRLLISATACWWVAVSNEASKRDSPTLFLETKIETGVEGISYIMKEVDIHSSFSTREQTESHKTPQTVHNNYDDIAFNENPKSSREAQEISRIIGGGEAKKGRYPYLASLTHDRSHTCGGSLIADDIILSAAHCWEYFDGVDLGRHDVTNKNENFERYNIEKFVKHPQYRDATGSYDNDFMIAKLWGWSEKQVASINKDASLPNSGEQLHVMGWGVTDTDTKQPADKLKDVSVDYMGNVECRNKKGSLDGFSQIFTLQDRITGNMMCAADAGEDACQGDSGGPLIQKRIFAKSDVQVGVVSWGLGCADPVFPGIYSRISSQYNWIKSVVCDMAEKPPPAFGCSKDYSPEGPTRPVTLELSLDRFPGETGWILRRSDGKSVAYFEIGGYMNTSEKLVITVLQLEVNKSYSLTMLDGYGDGLKFDNGYYKLWLGDPYIHGLIFSGTTYGKFVTHDFFVPEQIVVPVKPDPAPAPIPMNPPTSLPTTEQAGPYLTLGIKFDDYPEEVGWAITSVETQELLLSKPIGFYEGMKNEIVLETIPFPMTATKSSQYIFAMLDKSRDGLCCDKGQGMYQVFYGSLADNKVLFQGERYKYLQQFIFDITGDVVTPPPVPSPRRSDADDDEVKFANAKYYEETYYYDDDYYSATAEPRTLCYICWVCIAIVLVLV